MFARLRNPWPDRRAERTLGAVSLLVGVCVIAMIVFVAVRAWPTFEHNGLSWLGPGGSLDNADREHAGHERQPARVGLPPARLAARLRHAADHQRSRSVLGIVIALLSSIFIVELAPARLRRVAIPVIRLLASVPSVVYGLIGILVLVPFVGNHLVTASEKTSVQNVVELTGAGLRRRGRDPDRDDHADHDRADLRGADRRARRPGARARSRSGSIRCGRCCAVTLRAVRPAIVAAAVLATARALGEAVMIQMVSGGRSFSPNLCRRRADLLL